MRFDYKDINLVPKYSVVDSRSECDTTAHLGGYRFKNPVIPANMKSVINEEIAINLAKNNYFYVMHRFGTDNLKFVKKLNDMSLVSSISIGVNEVDYNLVDAFSIKNIKPDYITIDIAHGHCKKMKKMIKYVKEVLPETFVIAGNVSTIEATSDLDNWGADAIKVGIGPGCFVGKTIIKTDDGDKPISQIKGGDYVLTHKNRYKKVIATNSYLEDDDLININGNISTKNHKYYVVDKVAYDLSVDKYIRDYTMWVEAKNLNKKSHYLLSNKIGIDELVDIENINYVKNDGVFVFDMEVEEDSSYTVSTIYVHNSACTTYPTTGFGSRGIQASVVYECSTATNKPIIADGGIQDPMDITKSLVLGATMCMVGGMLSSMKDSPGKTIEKDGKLYKEFYGSASSKQSGKTKRVEGTVKLNPMKNTTIIDYMGYLSECLQSSISYGGGSKLECLNSVRWV